MSTTDSVLRAFRGYTAKWSVTLDEYSSGADINLTDCTLRMAIWNVAPDASVTTDSGAAVVLTSPSGGITITDAATGEIEIELTPTQTALLTAELPVYQIRLVNADDEHFPAASGVIFVSPQITHAS